MIRKLKIVSFLLILFLQGFLSQEGWGFSQDDKGPKKALSDSFHGVLDGMGSVGKGVWGLTTNTGKLIWHGTREGFIQGARGARKADGWMQKHLW